VLHVARTRIYQALPKDARAGKSIPEILGCSIEEFKEHIEAQFTEGMSWENHGKWHIDHREALRAPGASGGEPTIEEVFARLHFSNTQPLKARDNLRKGRRLEVPPEPPRPITTLEKMALLERAERAAADPDTPKPETETTMMLATLERIESEQSAKIEKKIYAYAKIEQILNELE
jgi:hypothetical protein